MKKFLMTSLVLTLLLVVCLPITILAGTNLNVTESDGTASWTTVHDGKYVVYVRNDKGALEYTLEQYNISSINIKSIFDEKQKNTGYYRIEVQALDTTGKIIASGSTGFRYKSPYEKLNAPTNLRWDGTKAKWNEAENATAYEISLYEANGSQRDHGTIYQNEYDCSMYGLKKGMYFTVKAIAPDYRESSSNESPEYAGTETEYVVSPSKCTVTVHIYDETSQQDNVGGMVSIRGAKGTDWLKRETTSYPIPQTSSAIIKAQADSDYEFVGWKLKSINGKILTDQETKFEFKVVEDVELYAVFQEKVAKHRITTLIYDADLKDYNTGGAIAISYDGKSYDDESCVYYDIDDGTFVTITAVPADGYEFLRWEANGNTLSTETDYNLTVAIDESYTAVFGKKAVEEIETTPTEEPTTSPTDQPTEQVTEQPTPTPIEQPTDQPTPTPTEQPTPQPTEPNWINQFKVEIAEPKTGEKPSTKATAVTDGFTITKVVWTPNDSTFKENVNYRVKIYVAIDEDRVLRSDYFGMVNDVVAEMPGDYDKDNFYIERDFGKITWSKASAWAAEELEMASKINVIPEIFSNQDLTQNITRREFAHVAVKLYEKLTGNKAVAIANNPFTDTDDSEVLKAFNVGITNGTSDTTFEPDALITREQMATMMTRALTKTGVNTAVDLNTTAKFADDGEMHDWGKASIYYMSSIEIIKGVGNNTFDVLGNATREQALLISERSASKFAK